MNDPILGSIVNCLQVANYQDIKKKGRILIPDSANLLGVVDSTGTLGPDEIFVQIKRSNFKDSNNLAKDHEMHFF
jgi:hypothetical protein